MRRAFTFVEVVIVLATLALIGVFLWPVIARRSLPQKGRCPSNLKQIGLGIAMYTQDYNGICPRVQLGSSTGWADMLQPYLKSRVVFLCPATPNYSLFSSDYFYNRHLSGLPSSKIKSPSIIVMIGDGDEAAPTWNSWAQLPSSAVANSFSPARRHLDGAHYCYADGHVKWYRHEHLSSQFKWNPLSP